jgi:hypothetical protein
VVSQCPDIAEKIEKVANEIDMEDDDETYLNSITQILCRDHCVSDIVKHRPENHTSYGYGGLVVRPAATYQHLAIVFEKIVPPL